MALSGGRSEGRNESARMELPPSATSQKNTRSTSGSGPLYCPIYRNVPTVFARDRSLILARDRSSMFSRATFRIATSPTTDERLRTTGAFLSCRFSVLRIYVWKKSVFLCTMFVLQYVALRFCWPLTKATMSSTSDPVGY